MIPSTQKYIETDNSYIYQRAQERMVYRDDTIEHLEQIASLKRTVPKIAL